MNERDVLEHLARGDLTVEEAQARLRLGPIAAIEDFARLDAGRHGRKGVPEVVYASGKTAEQLKKITESLLASCGRVIVSCLSGSDWQRLADANTGYIVGGDENCRTLVLALPGTEPALTGGKIGILSAGTSDVPVAEQARLMAEEMGCETIRAYDVGVAGVHRLAEPLREMIEAHVSCIVVAAGMEGALPSVVAGLVRVPVIGLPTSTGYGLGGKGVTALLAMLQSCSPGLVVVNIDNGIGAGATAALIANIAPTAPDSR